MIHHDLTQWPLAISVVTGAMSLDDQADFFRAWSEWLDRDEPFAVLRHFSDDASTIHPPDGAPEARLWLQEKASKIRSHVLGLATIVPEMAYGKLVRMDGQGLFGVPAEFFSVKAAAIDWIVETLFLPRGLPYNRLAIRSRMSELERPLRWAEQRAV